MITGGARPSGEQGRSRPVPRGASAPRSASAKVRGSAKTRARRPAEAESPYHGIHVAPLQPEHVKIRWLKDTRRCDHVRVRRHTCDCKSTIYELCHAGGLMFIRRTIREGDAQIAHETERLITARMEDLWMRLILGQAR
ncbi:hypothetical protein [Planotetraspora kaengkrachanensis]|uniref:Uncharacterized protein n=1 Tax=Planotetraspora kaengkrachanensis TaxID=575193 RepID=A0A8J3M4G8_9ACTN|nr:hypothetical protein [Planotetraspora kaengkrachanensis]GIG79284.1 hypothetical protein Pka01_24110 [Planotetraspora kaengkrachanensis]